MGGVWGKERVWGGEEDRAGLGGEPLPPSFSISATSSHQEKVPRFIIISFTVTGI